MNNDGEGCITDPKLLKHTDTAVCSEHQFCAGTETVYGIHSPCHCQETFSTPATLCHCSCYKHSAISTTTTMQHIR